MGAINKTKILKWYKKLFFHLMDLFLYNACISYKIQTTKNPAFSDFQSKVGEDLIEKYIRNNKFREWIID